MVRTQRAAAALVLAALLLPSFAPGQAGHGSSNALRFDPVSFTGPDPKEEFQDIQIVQKLNSQVPMDLRFRDEDGNAVTLGELGNGKPIVLALVYYECEMLCNRVLNALRDTLASDALSLRLGDDFEVMAVSIDPAETPELANEKKANYIAGLHESARSGWRFLTGAQLQIEELAQAVGFRYFYDEKSGQFAHSAGIMILTPDGRVSSYLLGLDYPPDKLSPALIMASNGRVGSLMERAVVLLCYAYDPTTGYGFQIFMAMRALATLVLGALLAFWAVMFWRGRRARKSPGQLASQPQEHASS
jgi:protein SCO1/2